MKEFYRGFFEAWYFIFEPVINLDKNMLGIIAGCFSFIAVLFLIIHVIVFLITN